MPRTLTTDRGDAGQRLDLILRRHLTDVDGATRTRVQAWIQNGQVTVNGNTVCRVSTRAAPGDVVAILLPQVESRRAAASNQDDALAMLDVLYEDDHLLAVDKRPGVVVHPTYRHAAGTLMNALLWHARAWPAGCRPSLVGRLDKLTSGIVVVAKSAAVHAALQQEMASRRSEKEYLAVVYGRVNVARGEINLRLGHDRSDRRRIVASEVEGAPSVTTFTRLARAGGLSLLGCRLVTGRTHQIRVHLAARGWPIVGDAVYMALETAGQPRWSHIPDPELASVLQNFPRQALHAWRVAFIHPVTRDRVLLEAPIPDDLENLLTVSGFVSPSQPLTTNPFFSSSSRTRSRRSPWSSTAPSAAVPPVPHARFSS
jgi:23S rRNA pseudouridine1911/1915/1917 synthase